MAVEMDIRSLTPTEKHKFVEYITECELTKSNKNSLNDAFNKCMNDKTKDHSLEVGVFAGITGLMLGLFLGGLKR